MQLKLTLLTTLIYLLSTLLPTALARSWNSQLELFDLGLIPKDPDNPDQPMLHMGTCGDIPLGGYGCGSFESDGVVALRAIYRCVIDFTLVRVDVCDEKTKYNRCVKNQRDGGEGLFKNVLPDKVICAEKSVVEG